MMGLDLLLILSFLPFLLSMLNRINMNSLLKYAMFLFLRQDVTAYVLTRDNCNSVLKINVNSFPTARSE